MYKDEKNRIEWIDTVKIVACIFVVLGHFFQSMVSNNILNGGFLYTWFNNSIYLFHIQLFFICSGYLYQLKGNVNTFKEWKNNVAKKFINLGIPFFTFSIITFLLKLIFNVNMTNKSGELLDILFINPTAPYWFLYVLFFIFLLVPTFRRKKNLIIFFIITLAMKIMSVFGLLDNCPVYLIRKLFEMLVWFAFGMVMNYFINKIKYNNKTLIFSIIGLIFFFVLTFAICHYNIGKYYHCIGFILSIISTMAIIVLINSLLTKKDSKKEQKMAQYTMPVFLMHTLCAAPIREGLLKFGISNSIVHIGLGIIISFAGPIILEYFFNKTTYLEFFIYPLKTIGKLRKKRKE